MRDAAADVRDQDVSGFARVPLLGAIEQLLMLPRGLLTPENSGPGSGNENTCRTPLHGCRAANATRSWKSARNETRRRIVSRFALRAAVKPVAERFSAEYDPTKVKLFNAELERIQEIN